MCTYRERLVVSYRKHQSWLWTHSLDSFLTAKSSSAMLHNITVANEAVFVQITKPASPLMVYFSSPLTLIKDTVIFCLSIPGLIALSCSRVTCGNEWSWDNSSVPLGSYICGYSMIETRAMACEYDVLAATCLPRRCRDENIFLEFTQKEPYLHIWTTKLMQKVSGSIRPWNNPLTIACFTEKNNTTLVSIAYWPSHGTTGTRINHCGAVMRLIARRPFFFPF